MAIHNAYLRMNEAEKLAVDAAFNSLAATLREELGGPDGSRLRLNMADPAERVVEAIAAWVETSRSRH